MAGEGVRRDPGAGSEGVVSSLAGSPAGASGVAHTDHRRWRGRCVLHRASLDLRGGRLRDRSGRRGRLGSACSGSCSCESHGPAGTASGRCLLSLHDAAHLGLARTPSAADGSRVQLGAGSIRASRSAHDGRHVVRCRLRARECWKQAVNRAACLQAAQEVRTRLKAAGHAVEHRVHLRVGIPTRRVTWPTSSAHATSNLLRFALQISQAHSKAQKD